MFIHRELLREEESVNLLREQVNQMRSLRMESDGKDAFILQLQTEVCVCVFGWVVRLRARAMHWELVTASCWEPARAMLSLLPVVQSRGLQWTVASTRTGAEH